MGVVANAIPTGEDTTGGDYAAFMWGHLADLARAAGVTLPDNFEVADTEPLLAFVAQGRWVVDCPDCGSNRSMVWSGTPLYMCPHCWNVRCGGELRRVAFPEDRAEVEAALLARPFPADRNYTPGETPHLLDVQTEIMADLSHTPFTRLGAPMPEADARAAAVLAAETVRGDRRDAGRKIDEAR